MARYQKRLDAEAFQEIVSRFMTPALAVAQQMLWDRTLAEDAVQETFLRIVRRADRYRPSMPFSSWFYAILRNVCKDMLRHQARQTSLLERFAHHEATREETSVGDSADTLELLDALPRDAQAVLTLRIVHNMSFREVAVALGISEEAAKKRAQRALCRLRKHREVVELL